jgi:Skp family chaperone for outer membrane proteins
MATSIGVVCGLTLAFACANQAAGQIAPVQQTAPPMSRPAQPGTSKAFPEGARLGFIDLPRVATVSSHGQAMAARIEELRSKKAAQVSERGKQVEALQSKLSQGQSVLNDDARVRLQRAFERAQIDFQRFAQDAQAEVQDLQQELQREFTAQLFPIIGQVAKEKNLWAVFSVETNLLWHDPALDLSEEVAQRLDASGQRR